MQLTRIPTRQDEVALTAGTAMLGSLPDRRLRIGIVGSYPPRQCGIATFTNDLCDALSAASGDAGLCQVVAMDDLPQGHAYADRVRVQIPQDDSLSYRLAADFLNVRNVGLLLVQHEYGIFGGRAGSHLLAMLDEARMPVITTLHTVLPQPSEHIEHVTRRILRMSDRVVVLCHRAMGILQEVYQAPPEKIAMIPHGIPDLAMVEPGFHKDRFGLENRKVMLTFGLLSPAKGIEYALRALPPVVQRHPDLLYVVLGATHPHVRRDQGECYREGLQRLAEELGIAEHVRFDDRYVDLDELCHYLAAADLYVTPYLGEEQIVSGTLAYALGAGKAVVSTPYSYAREMLADGRGRLVPFRDPQALTRELVSLLDDPVATQAMRKRAYLHTRDMVWQRVGERYLDLCAEVLRQPRRMSTTAQRLICTGGPTEASPSLDLRALRAMTDDTGMFQHAHYTIPNRWHGYCTDDNARALQLAVLAHDQTRDGKLLDLAQVYLSFLHHAYDPVRRRFRNFLSYDRRWLEETGSEDSQGRAIAALGVVVAMAPSAGLRMGAVDLFDDALAASGQLSAPRAMAEALIGIHAYLRRYSGDTDARRAREDLAVRLFALFDQSACGEWPWPEPVLTYANARLPHALLLAGQWLPHGEMVEQALRSLDWLARVQTGPQGEFSPVGNRGWYARGGEMAQFDQQPIEAQVMLDACVQAYHLTADPRWTAEARRCLHWFQGKNVLGLPLVDSQTGGCRDGLIPQGVNQNEGAESTLAWLLAQVAMRGLGD